MLVGHSMTEILMRHVMFYLLGSERPSRREYAVLRELQPKSVLMNSTHRLNQPNWYIVELSEYGETATYPEMAAAIGSVFGQEVEYFIPVYHEELGSYTSVNVLFEGYVFVKDSQIVRDNFINIKDSRLFSGLLKSSGKIRMLDSKTITSLKQKLKNSLKKKLISGVKVKIHDGVFENLDGEILSTEKDGKVANVRIICLSREIIAPIPITCLEKI